MSYFWRNIFIFNISLALNKCELACLFSVCLSDYSELKQIKWEYTGFKDHLSTSYSKLSCSRKCWKSHEKLVIFIEENYFGKKKLYINWFSFLELQAVLRKLIPSVWDRWMGLWFYLTLLVGWHTYSVSRGQERVFWFSLCLSI